jgi:hypothetical protein
MQAGGHCFRTRSENTLAARGWRHYDLTTDNSRECIPGGKHLLMLQRFGDGGARLGELAFCPRRWRLRERCGNMPPRTER